MTDNDVGVNDGNFVTGFGAITVLELDEVFSFRARTEGQPGSATPVRRDRHNFKGRISQSDIDTMTGDLIGEAGSTSDVKRRYSFEEVGYGWEIVAISKTYSETEPRTYNATIEKMVNGLITAPAQALTLVDSAAMTAVPITISADLAGGGTYSLVGEDKDGNAALAGLSVVAGEITGTPVDGAGDYFLNIIYTEGTGENVKETSRIINVTLT